MKVVVLNGSPRRSGLVSRMLDEVVAGMPEGVEVERFFVHDLTVRPCCGCMKCRSLHRCVLAEDDAHRVAEALRGADALVVGSPCYWGSMSGELKVLFDRMVYALMEDREGRLPAPLHKGKRAVMVATCNTAWPFSVWFYQTERSVPRVAGDLPLERLPGGRDAGQEQLPEASGADGPGDCLVPEVGRETLPGITDFPP